ncbi:MAG: hypothetical protein K2N05_10470 [Muribaculaceae bacterium]|nr:hypothetical protein [Muribaculaceae bacterium]
MNKLFTSIILASGLLVTSGSSLYAAPVNQSFDLARFRYQIDSKSVFHNKNVKEKARLNSLVSSSGTTLKAESKNPDPILTLPAANEVGSIDAPNNQLWYYTAQLDYIEIPPHDDVAYTDRVLQEYTFTIYDENMKEIGVIKDKMEYAENEVRTVLCELTPVVTRNFFNTDDKLEFMVALGVNRVDPLPDGTFDYGNNYRTLVYQLESKNDQGYNKPIDTYDDLVADVVEGAPDGDSDNFYITFMTDLFEPEGDGTGFWDFLLAQKVAINIYGKAIDEKGPRRIFEKIMPVIQFAGDQQDVPIMISTRRGDDVVYLIQEYALPFYNRYDDPMNDDMTQREGNHLIVNLYTASQTGLTQFSHTEIPVVLDTMNDENGNPTALFSYFSVGNLGYSRDILFDAPGASAEKPDFVVTRGNYQRSTDSIVNSFFTYNNDGSLKNTLCIYSAGAVDMGTIPGFGPQTMFVGSDRYGYVYNFIDLYTGNKVCTVDATYYYDDDSDPELLTVNCARTPAGDSYQYVFEMRYPLVDDDENDIMRFMYLNSDGTFSHIENVNMGHNVVYAQSYLSTEALAPHAYSDNDGKAYMLLIKRGQETGGNVEELMVADAISEKYPSGNTLLLVGPDDNGVLASIVPEFGADGSDGRLFVYYYNDTDRKYTLDIYSLPLNGDAGVDSTVLDSTDIKTEGSMLVAKGAIKVYSLDGKLVAEGYDKVEFASLDKGVYVVTANGKSIKIAK